MIKFFIDIEAPGNDPMTFFWATNHTIRSLFCLWPLDVA